MYREQNQNLNCFYLKKWIWIFNYKMLNKIWLYNENTTTITVIRMEVWTAIITLQLWICHMEQYVNITCPRRKTSTATQLPSMSVVWTLKFQVWQLTLLKFWKLVSVRACECVVRNCRSDWGNNSTNSSDSEECLPLNQN